MQAICDQEHYAKRKSNEHTTEEDHLENSKRRFLDEENLSENLEDKKEGDGHLGIDKQNRKTLKLHAKHRSFKVSAGDNIESHGTEAHKMSIHQREQSDNIPLKIDDDEDEEATNTHGNNDEKVLESRTQPDVDDDRSFSEDKVNKSAIEDIRFSVEQININSPLSRKIKHNIIFNNVSNRPFRSQHLDS